LKFSKWLYNLSNTDHYILIAFFFIGLGLSYLTILLFRAWHYKIHDSDKYSHDVRITPFALVGVALIFATVLYMSIGESVTGWVTEFTQ